MLKKIINSNKKIFLTLLYTFLIINIIIFSNYKTSNAKYIKKSETEFIYQNNLAQLYQESTGLKTTYSNLSTKANLVFNLTFTSNEIALNESTDIYEIVLPNNCNKINNINLSNAQVKKQFNYSVTCSVNNDSGDINIPITIKEKINDEDKFVYLTGNFKMSRQEFNSKFEDNQQKEYFVIKKSDISNLYSKLLNWLETYYFGDNLNEFIDASDDVDLIEYAIEKYIAVYQNASVNASNDIIDKNTTEKITLSGINIEYIPEKEEYKFTITNNFVGYARFYSQDKYEILYFSTETDLNNIFYEYLDEIYSEENYKEIIKNYLLNFQFLDNGDITNFILQNNSNEIPGLLYLGKHQIKLNNLLNHAKYFNKSPIHIEFGQNLKMISEFYTGLEYYKNSISEETMSLLKSSSLPLEIKNSIVKNSTKNNNPTSYSEYFSIYDKNQYIIFHIFSDVEIKMTYISLDFIKTDIFKELEFINDDNNLTINVSLDNKDTNYENNKQIIESFIENLNNILDIAGDIKNIDGTYGITNSSITNNTDTNTTSLTFTVTKNIPE